MSTDLLSKNIHFCIFIHFQNHNRHCQAFLIFIFPKSTWKTERYMVLYSLSIRIQRIRLNERARKAFIPHLYVHSTHIPVVFNFYVDRNRWQEYLYRSIAVFRDTSLLADNHDHQYDLRDQVAQNLRKNPDSFCGFVFCILYNFRKRKCI